MHHSILPAPSPFKILADFKILAFQKPGFKILVDLRVLAFINKNNVIVWKERKFASKAYASNIFLFGKLFVIS